MSTKTPIRSLSLVLATLIVAAAFAQPRPDVWVLATGGTIAGTGKTDTAAAYQPGKLHVDQLIHAVPALEQIAELHAEQIANIGSQDMNESVWFELAKRANTILAEPDAAGIVITHGTDTLEETAFFLDLVVAHHKPVVLVGAQRAANALSPDGPRNLLLAVRVAADPDSRNRGVLVVMNDQIHAARHATKTHTTAVNAFRSPNVGPIGTVNTKRVRYFHPPATDHNNRPKFQLPPETPLPRVDILYVHAGMTTDLARCALLQKTDGIVVAGVGNGNMPADLLDLLQNAAGDGVAIVRSTRTGAGFVSRNIEINDDNRGFVVARDLNPQKARVLLQLALAAGHIKPPEIQRAFDRASSPP